jgi:hypothetical protein
VLGSPTQCYVVKKQLQEACNCTKCMKDSGRALDIFRLCFCSLTSNKRARWIGARIGARAEHASSYGNV